MFFIKITFNRGSLLLRFLSGLLVLLIYSGNAMALAEKDSLLLEIKKERDDSSKANLINLLVWNIKYSEPDSALIYGYQAYELSHKIKNTYQIANSANRIGVVYWIKGEYEKALEYLNEAYLIYEKEDNENGRLSSLVNMGLINQNLSNYAQSLELLYEALRITDNQQDSTARATVLTNIGNTYYLMEDYKEAKKHLLESVHLKVKLNFTQTLHKTQMNLGVIYQKLEDEDSALYFYQQALIKASEKKDWKNITLSQSNIGSIHYSRNQLKEALQYFRKALTIYNSKRYENPYDMGILITTMSGAFGEINQLDSAQYYAELALTNGIEANNPQMIRDAYLAISENEQRQSKHQAALENYQHHITYRDSVFRLDNKREMDEILTKYETEKKEQQIQLQELIINQQSASNERNLIIIFGLILLVFFLIVTGWLIKLRMQKHQEMMLQKKQVEFKELQLTAIIESQEMERKRFSRDIHDSFGQLISILKLNVETIEKENDRDKRHNMFEKSVDVLNEMYGELKNVCFNLMPQSLVNFGLIPSLREFADRINNSQVVFVEVLAFDMEGRLTELQEISIYRVVQEWVNNILKYSDATQVTIQLTRDPDEITVTIEDDGMGFDAAKLTMGSGNGWKNINSRSNLIKGVIELDTNPRMKGNLFSINIPVAHMAKPIAIDT